MVQMRLIPALLMVLLSSPSTVNSAKPQLNWAINTAPPFHVAEGPFKQLGICDALLSGIKQQLPQLNHRILVMPQPRIHQALNEKEPLCFPCMIHRPNPTTTAVFSQPTHWYRPQGIITRQALANHLSERFGRPVVLAQLFTDTTFRLGLAAGRKYGTLEPLLEPYRQTAVVRSGDESPIALLKMIQSGRIDYTLDYDIILTYLQKTAPEQAKGLVHLPVAELPTTVAGAVGCTNNEWGQQQIALINTVLPKVKADPHFRKSLELWFNSQLIPQSKPAQNDEKH